jgi:hypothetical protein
LITQAINQKLNSCCNIDFVSGVGGQDTIKALKPKESERAGKVNKRVGAKR